MMLLRLPLLFLLLATLATPCATWAQDTPAATTTETATAPPPDPLPKGKLRVATHEAPPFVMKDEAGWRGISIDLWKAMANELHLDYEFVDMDLKAMLDAVGSGEADLAVGPISITAQREARLDFTHPYYTTGLSYAVEGQSSPGVLDYFWPFFTWQFVSAVATLVMVLFIAGLVLWLFERKANAEQFGGKPVDGLGNAFWWSAVTMTTVGYGDKAPATPMGRFVALIWMFASVMVISIFTGTIAASITTTALHAEPLTTAQLRDMTVATVTGSSSQEYLNAERLSSTPYASVSEAMQALENGKVNAILYDRPILLYLVRGSEDSRLQVLPGTHGREDYGFALPHDAASRDDYNQAMLRILQSDAWADIKFRYLGEE